MTSTRLLQVTGFANGGAGIAHDDDGRVVFVAGALPGELVRAQIDKQKPSFAQARAVTIVEASPHRIDPLCPAAAAGAGCCDLSYAAPDYATQLRGAALTDVLTRIGRFTPGEDTPTAPVMRALDRSPVGWRVRTRLAVGPDGAPGLRARGSARLIAAPCAGPVDGMLHDIAGLGAAPGSELVLAVGSEGVRHAAALSADRSAARARNGRRGAQRARGLAAGVRAETLLEGAGLVSETVGSFTWQIPVTGFWQAHRAAPRIYAAAAAELLGRVPVRGSLRVWDLYGGVGVLGAGLLDAGLPVAGIDLVETDPRALAAAERTLAQTPVRTHYGDVGAVIPALAAPDVVIADPPRSGAGAAVIAAIAAAGPRAVLHIGCDPAAFARDLRDYISHGYRVLEWHGYDAFPLSHHMEAIALLASP